MATGVGGAVEDRRNLRDKQERADSKVYTRKSFKGLQTNSTLHNSQKLSSTQLNSGRELGFSRSEVASDDSSSIARTHKRHNSNPALREMQSGNGISGTGFLQADNHMQISLAYKTKDRRELRRKLEGELNLVRALVKRLERCGTNLRPVGDEISNTIGKLKRVHSEVGSVGGHEGRPVGQLSVAVQEHSLVASDNIEKEKRTPKANQFYQSSDFILGKEKIPPSEQNKKSKSMIKKNEESGSVLGMGNPSSKIFKNCSALLDKLMKHKHGWVFNNPVDAKALGLHDYFTIIKNPMDLGTVKSRLNTNWYKSHKDFAEDVRRTFHNAMTYNPKGHDVHIMADMLQKIFEEKWGSIDAEYVQELRAFAEYEASLSTPTSRKAPPLAPKLPPSIDTTKILERSESMTNPVVVKSRGTPGRKPVPKKPKARDLHKRDMTYLEKQKLSTELQNLPSEKLDNVVQIIRKRNPSLCQNDDEIEVDIDSVDTETLWELDRFVMYYKKNMSKLKKLTEVPQVTGDESTTEKNKTSTILDRPNDKKAEEKNIRLSSPAQSQKQGGNASKSDSSGSSSSDSGSSSSESDSDNSSA